jgi:hypothetical protein
MTSPFAAKIKEHGVSRALRTFQLRLLDPNSFDLGGYSRGDSVFVSGTPRSTARQNLSANRYEASLGGRGCPPYTILTTPAGAPTAHTPIATPIPRHDAAAEATCRSVAEVHDFTQSVSGVDRTSRRPLIVSGWSRAN